MLPSKGIEIALKPIAGSHRVLPTGINQVLQQEYAAKYLENIGANPTADNIDFVLNNLAIKDALVMPVWAREKIVIIPGMNDKVAEFAHMMQDTSDRHKPTSKQQQNRPSKSTTIGKKKVSGVKFNDGASVDHTADESTCGSVHSKSDDESHTKKRRSRKTDQQHTVSKRAMHTLDLLTPLVFIVRLHRKTAESFRSLLTPPHFQRDDLLGPVQTFVTSLVDYVPQVKNDTSGKLFKAIRKLLCSDRCLRLFGLLCHFCYWNSVHPAVRATVRLLRDADGTLFEDADLSPKLEERIMVPTVLMRSDDHYNVLQQHLLHHGSDDHNIAPLGRDMHHIDEMFNNEVLRAADEYEVVHGGRAAAVSFDDCVAVNSDGDDDNCKGDRNKDSSTGAHESLGMQDLRTISSLATEASLTVFEKEQLFMQLEACLISVFRQMGRRKSALVCTRQALISCAHFVVDDILTTEYAWFSALAPDTTQETTPVKMTPGNGRHTRAMGGPPAASLVQDPELLTSIRQLNLRVRRLAHQSISDIIDPSRMYTSTTLLNALVGQTKAMSTALSGKAKYYGTSVAIKAVLGDTTSDKARRFLQRGIKLQTTLPGVVEPYVDPAPRSSTKPSTVQYKRSLGRSATGESALSKSDDLHRRSSWREDSVKPETTADRHMDSGFNRNNHDKLGSSGSFHRHHSPLSRPVRRPLDFTNLFSNQPEARYYPNGMPAALVNATEDNDSTSEALVIDRNDVTDGDSSVGNLIRQNTLSGYFSLQSAQPVADDSNNSSHQTDLDEADADLVTAILNRQQQKAADGGEVSSKLARFARIRGGIGASRSRYAHTNDEQPSPGLGGRNRPKQQLPSQSYIDMRRTQQSASTLDRTAQHSYDSNAMHFPSSGSVGSASLMSDCRSVAYNKNAAVQLSLKAKASLMTLMVDKAAHSYAHPRTNQTVARADMIRGKGGVVY